MKKTQWRRHQRSKKGVVVSFEDETIDPNGKQEVVEPFRRPVKERLSIPPIKENPNEYDELDSEFMDFDPDFDVICNVVSILLAKYDMVSEVEDSEEDFDPEDIKKYQPICYYVTNDGCESEQIATFEKPDSSMKNHLKPLFNQVKVDEVNINKVLVDGGAVVNLMPLSLLKRIGKSDKELKPHNIILSNCEGKAGHSLDALQVNLNVGTVVRSTLFMVVPSKANFNLVLGRQWIHGIGVVPSTMHQRILIWRDDGTFVNIEVDQSYFLAEVNQITRKTFDKSLAKIAPCSSAESVRIDQADASYVRLHPTHGFIWKRETPDAKPNVEDLNSLTLGNDEDNI